MKNWKVHKGTGWLATFLSISTAVCIFTWSANVLTPLTARYVEVTKQHPSLQFWQKADRAMPQAPPQFGLVDAAHALGCGNSALSRYAGSAASSLGLERLWAKLHRQCLIDASERPKVNAASAAAIVAVCHAQEDAGIKVADAITEQARADAPDARLVRAMVGQGIDGRRKIQDACQGAPSKEALLALAGWKFAPHIDTADNSYTQLLVRDSATVASLLRRVDALPARAGQFATLREGLPAGMLATSILALVATALCAPRWTWLAALAASTAWMAMLINLDFVLAYPSLRYTLVTVSGGTWLSADVPPLGRVSLWPPFLLFSAVMLLTAAAARCPARLQERLGASVKWRLLYLGGVPVCLLSLYAGGSAGVALAYAYAFVAMAVVLAREFGAESVFGISENGTGWRIMAVAALAMAPLANDSGHLLSVAITLSVCLLMVGSARRVPGGVGPGAIVRLAARVPAHILLAVGVQLVAVLLLAAPKLPVVAWIWESSRTVGERVQALLNPEQAEMSDFAALHAFTRSVTAKSGFQPFDVPWNGLNSPGLPPQSNSDFAFATFSGWLSSPIAFLAIAAWLFGCLALSMLAFRRAAGLATRHVERLALLTGAIWMISITVRGAIGLLGTAGLTIATGVPVAGLSNGLVSCCEFGIALALILPNLKGRTPQ